MLSSIHLTKFMHVALLWILLIFPGMAVAQFSDGSGTKEDPYQVESLDQLQAIADSANLNKHFILITDIDASATVDWNAGKGFEPIGISHAFRGTFDGNGHIISNLVIHRDDETGVGLFGYLEEAVIKNIGLENIDIIGESRVGGLVGWAMLSQIYNSFVEGRVEGTSNRVGGLIGMYGDSGCMRNEFIYASYAQVDVTGKNSVGGLVGLIDAVGFIARVGKINSVINSKEIHGIVRLPNMVLENTDLVKCGISEVYATGPITGESNVGGLYGYGIEDDTNKSSYWDTETSGQSKGVAEGDSDGITGLTTEQMTGQDAFIHMYKLDFKEIWQLTVGYPVLAWQDPDDAVDPPEVPIVSVTPEYPDFGEVETDSSKTMVILLENKGTVTLNGEVEFIVPVSDMYYAFDMLRGQGPFNLEPDSILIMEIKFMPREPVEYDGLFHINHDAPNEPSVMEILMKGTGKESTSLEDHIIKPLKMVLHQNYPNPFNPSTQIRFAIPESAHVNLTVYNLLGQKVATLVNETRSPGWHDVTFDATGLSSGVLMYKIEAGEYVETRSMMLVK